MITSTDKLRQPHSESGVTSPPFSIQSALVAVRCWWRVATPIAVLLGAVAAIAVYYFHKPAYTAEAWLLIKDKQDVILKPLDSDPKRFIQNQIEILRSPRLLGPLAAKPAVMATPELQNEADIAAALARCLKVTARNQSDIFVVSFTSVSPTKAEMIVKEVTESYMAFHSSSEAEQDDRIIRLLEEQRVARYEEMNQLRENVRSLSMQITGIDPFRGKTKSDEPAVVRPSPVAVLEEDIVKQSVAQDYLAAEIRAQEEIQKDEVFEAPATEVELLVESDPSYLGLLAKISKNKDREAEYVKTAKDLKNNAAYNQIQAELIADAQALEQLRDVLRKKVNARLASQFEMEGKDHIRRLKQDFIANGVKLKILKENFEKSLGEVRQSATKFTGDSLQLEFRRAKLEQVTKIHDEISARILAITTEQRAPDRVELFKEASLPTHPDEVIPWKKLAAGIGIAFLLPFAIAIAWEHVFQRVSSRSQLQVASKIEVVGEVTALPSRSRRTAKSGSMSDSNVLLFEESIDSLRTYLTLVDSLKGFQVLAVTSAVSREGKTSLAAQLAVSLARATGELTLVIDGDVRAPDIHEIFNTEREPGLCEVLRSECSVDDAIETAFSEKLHILSAGQLLSSPHRLFSNGKFSDLLEELRGLYRYIVIDTPPILPASEALIMARAADTAVLCARCDYSRLDQVREAYSRLVAAGVNTAGAVLNGVSIKHYSYKYGSYGYAQPPAASRL